MPRTLETQLRKTYFSLRIGVAALGMIFPFLLWVGGLTKHITLRPSMSAYYYATRAYPDPPDCKEVDAAMATLPAGTMRNWFVGFLFAVGAMLFVNKGSTDRENYALNAAGIFAAGVALCPMAWDCDSTGKFSWHGAFAFSFFAAIAFVCAFCADDTLHYLPQAEQGKFRNTYRALALFMVASPATAWAFNVFTQQTSKIYWTEVFGIESFALYWFVKSREIAKIIQERRSKTLSSEEHLPV